jgi:hypothetical protein
MFIRMSGTSKPTCVNWPEGFEPGLHAIDKIRNARARSRCPEANLDCRVLADLPNTLARLSVGQIG